VDVVVDLAIVENGVIVLQPTWPDDMDGFMTSGYVELRNAEGQYVASYDIDLVSDTALGPFPYGTYTITIYPYDSRFAPVIIEDLELQSASIDHPVIFTTIETIPLTLNINWIDGVPPVDGWVYVWNLGMMLPEDGIVEVDVPADLSDISYSIYSSNYEPISGYWLLDDGTSIEVTLDTLKPVLEVKVEDQHQQPVSGLYVMAMCDWTWPTLSETETPGTYRSTLYRDDESCELVIEDPLGVFTPPDPSPIVEITGQFTTATIQGTVSDQAINDVEVSVQFEGDPPTVPVWLQLNYSNDEEGVYWSAQAEVNDGIATFPALMPGTYEVYLDVRDAQYWRYSQYEPKSIVVSPGSTSHEITVHQLETQQVTFVLQTSDGLPLDRPVEVRVTSGEGGAYWTRFQLSGESGTTYTTELLAGDYWLYVQGSGLYRAPNQPSFEVADQAVTMPVVMTRIAAIDPNEVVDPTPTETPTEVPTETPTEVPTETPTEEPEGEQQLVARFELPGGEDISGAPFELWAPTAATFQVGPLYTGVVGANNTIVIDGLIPGKYRLVVYPEGMDAIAAMIQVGTAPITEVLVQVDEEGEVAVTYLETATPTASPETPTVSPTDPTATADSDVKGLPTTGSGSDQSIGTFAPIAAMIAAALLVMSIPAGIRWNNGKQRR
ncbi:MAG: hypothetical protein M9950_05025, partial [Thermomicrobiales bacterium]|nr:hypothetical protein [Thermomicrobiales bacterium]